MAVTLDSVQCPPQFSREQRIFYCTCFCYYYFAVLYDQPVFQSWPHLAFKGSYSKDILMCTSMWVNSWLFFVFVCFLQKRMKKKKKAFSKLHIYIWKYKSSVCVRCEGMALVPDIQLFSDRISFHFLVEMCWVWQQGQFRFLTHNEWASTVRLSCL